MTALLSDPTARDYYVRYRDYIKNVASSEIYSTWPDATIRANVLDHHVVYAQSCIHGVVPQQRLQLYDHVFYGI